MIELIFFGLFSVTVALAGLLLVILPSIRRERNLDADAIERFTALGLQHVALSRQTFAFGEHAGVRMVASWHRSRRVSREPVLLLQAKVAGTENSKLHAVTKLQDDEDEARTGVMKYGWHDVGDFLVAQGHDSTIKEEGEMLARLSPDTVAWLTDRTRFPEGIALRSSYFTLRYGGSTALILAGGDEHTAMDIDIQTRLPFYVSDDRIAVALDDLASASRKVAEDLARRAE